MSARLLRRLVGTALAAALGTTGVLAASVATAPAAHAGQVGVTIGVKGAGQVLVVEGSLEDGGSDTCSFTSNQDDRVTNWCPRIRNSEPFEAWVWLHPFVSPDPAGEWTFDHWEGCDQTRTTADLPECAVHSGAFSSDERRPVAVFRDRNPPTVTGPTATQSPTTPGRVTFDFRVTRGSAECRAGTAPFSACSSPLVADLSEGDHVFSVRGVDPSGNVSAVRTASISIVDTALSLAPPTLSRSSRADFAFTTAAGNEFYCGLLGEPWTPCGSGRSGQITLTGLADGEHVFYVRAGKGSFTDVQPASHRWTVDTVAPQATLAETTVSGRTARFTFASPDDAVLTECRLVRPGTTPSWASCASPVSYTGLAGGSHRFEVRAHDAAGNVQQDPAAHSWTVSTPTDPGPGPGPRPDTTAPDTTLAGGPAQGAWSLERTATYTVAGTEPGSVACTLDGRAQPCSAGPLILDGLGAGTHVLTVAATDASGNADPTPASRTWTVPRSAAELPRGKGWRLRPAPSSYAGAVLEATRKRSALVVAVVDARRVALVVSGAKKHGTVKVYAGSRLLGKVRPASRKPGTRRLVELPALAAAFTGEVRVVVATQGRPVRIEGVGVATG